MSTLHIAEAPAFVIVNDGATRWVGRKSEVYGWLSRHDIDRGHDANYNTPNSATMTADQYQSLCDETQCFVDTSGSHGPEGADPYELIEELSNAGAAYLYIH
jgi:hypothetical protein